MIRVILNFVSNCIFHTKEISANILALLVQRTDDCDFVHHRINHRIQVALRLNHLCSRYMPVGFLEHFVSVNHKVDAIDQVTICLVAFDHRLTRVTDVNKINEVHFKVCCGWSRLVILCSSRGVGKACK